MNTLERKARSFLDEADVRINGGRPWDIQIHNPAFFKRVLQEGSLGLGESYMDKWWDVGALDEFFMHILSARLEKKVKNNFGLLLLAAKERIFNSGRKGKAFEIGQQHYDIGNDLYTRMLDKRMTYTCGYWKEATTLDEAQEAKLDLVCQKIGLKKGMAVLDIGCGWGSFAIFAAERYGAHVTGVTVSQEQIDLGNKKVKGLPVELKYQDYREVKGTFDRIVSLGMYEHVGYKNYRTFMETAANLLKDNGLFLLHTIGGNTSVKGFDPWIGKYIFTNSMLPSIAQTAKAFEDLFVMEDWHNFGAYYDTTLMHWMKNVDAHWDDLKSTYDDRFYRMWKYYLMASAGSFRSRKNQLWQIVLSKHGIPGGYLSIR